MATLRNKRKFAALNKENCEEHPRCNLAQNSNDPKSEQDEDYITQVFEETEGRVTKKLSQVFSRRENRISDALSRLDDFLMNPRIQGHSGSAPETSRNAYSTNQGTYEDDSQSDPHPEAGIFQNQMTRNSGPEDGHDNHFWKCCGILLNIYWNLRKVFVSHLNVKLNYNIVITSEKQKSSKAQKILLSKHSLIKFFVFHNLNSRYPEIFMSTCRWSSILVY